MAHKVAPGGPRMGGVEKLSLQGVVQIAQKPAKVVGGILIRKKVHRGDLRKSFANDEIFELRMAKIPYGMTWPKNDKKSTFWSKKIPHPKSARQHQMYIVVVFSRSNSTWEWRYGLRHGPKPVRDFRPKKSIFGPKNAFSQRCQGR